MVVALLVGKPCENAISFILTGDRMMRHWKKVKEAMHGSRRSMMAMGLPVWSVFEKCSSWEGSGESLQTAVVMGISVCLSYIERALFRGFEDYPYRLAVVIGDESGMRGSIRNNLD